MSSPKHAKTEGRAKALAEDAIDRLEDAVNQIQSIKEMQERAETYINELKTGREEVSINELVPIGNPIR